jgi:hypothetical protein
MLIDTTVLQKCCGTCARYIQIVQNDGSTAWLCVGYAEEVEL